MCEQGKNQSPVDLSREVGKYTESNSISIQGKGYKNYYEREMTFETNKYVQFLMDKDEKLELTLPNGQVADFTGCSVKVKMPSEHCIDMKRYDLEIQIYHNLPGTKTPGAAISLFWDTSAAVGSTKSCPFI